MNNKIFNQSEFLRDAIEEENHDNLALLWIDITKSNITCLCYVNKWLEGFSLHRYGPFK